MNANVDYIGMLNMLRQLADKGVITTAEAKKIAAYLAQKTGANVVASF